MKCPFCRKGMKPRKFDGHTSAACVNRKCQAYFRIEEMAGWQEQKALEALEIEAILTEGRAEREARLERVQRKAENRARRVAKFSKEPIAGMVDHKIDQVPVRA